MNVGSTQKAYVQIHTAVLLFGFTAILGKLIPQQELALVWHRLWIAVVGLIVFPGVIRGLKKVPTRKLPVFAGIGVVVSLHWLTFYASIKLGNVSIALASLATTTLFISIIEPLVTGSRFQWLELLLGLFVIVGIVLVLDVGEAYYGSIAVGLIAAFLAALFSSLNKRHIGDYNPMSISAVELLAGFVFLTVVIPFWGDGFDLNEFDLMRTSEYAFMGWHIPAFWLFLVLGWLCTSIAYGLALASLKKLTAFSSALAVNLEPVYGILMAIAVFQENKDLTPNFYIGTTIILLSVALHPILKKYWTKKKI